MSTHNPNDSSTHDQASTVITHEVYETLMTGMSDCAVQQQMGRNKHDMSEKKKNFTSRAALSAGTNIRKYFLIEYQYGSTKCDSFINLVHI